MSIYDGCLDEGIGVVDVRHEQTAAHAADGWARVTGQPGVAIVTAGPGLTDAVTGVATAWRANIPMVIIGGQAPRVLPGHGRPPGHEPRRPDAADHQVGGVGAECAAAGRVRVDGVPHCDHERAGAGLPRDAARSAVRHGERRRRDRVGAILARRPASAPIRGTSSAPSSCCAARNGPVCLVGSQLFWSRRREAYPEFVARLRHAGLRQRPGARQPRSGRPALVSPDP